MTMKDSFLQQEASEGFISGIQLVIAELQGQANKRAKIFHIDLGAASVEPIFSIDGKSVLNTDRYKYKLEALERLRLGNVIRSYNISTVGMAEVDVNLDALQLFRNRLDKFILNEREKNRPKLLTQSKSGGFYYNGIRVEVDSKKIGSQILAFLLNHSDQTGFLSYADIERLLVESGREKKLNKEESIKRIKNGIDDLFYRAKINGRSWKNETLSGVKLIKSVPKLGIRLNNQIV